MVINAPTSEFRVSKIQRKSDKLQQGANLFSETCHVRERTRPKTGSPQSGGLLIVLSVKQKGHQMMHPLSAARHLQRWQTSTTHFLHPLKDHIIINILRLN